MSSDSDSDDFSLCSDSDSESVTLESMQQALQDAGPSLPLSAIFSSDPPPEASRLQDSSEGATQQCQIIARLENIEKNLGIPVSSTSTRPITAIRCADASSSASQESSESATQLSQINARLENIEKNIGILVSSTSTRPITTMPCADASSSASQVCDSHQDTNPREPGVIASDSTRPCLIRSALPSASPPSTSNLPSTVQRLDVDVSSPIRELLKAKIEFVKKVMIDLELQKMKTVCGEKKGISEKIPPPTNLSSVSDDVFIAWCGALDNGQYGENLFALIVRLQDAEEKERKALRGKTIYTFKNEDSPHRRYLQAKIGAIKQAIRDYYPVMKEKLRPDLPADPYSMDVDVFLVWYLHDPYYLRYQRQNRYPQGSIYNTYDTELGCVMADLWTAGEEERQYLVRSGKARLPY